jgi:hypothetical protein
MTEEVDPDPREEDRGLTPEDMDPGGEVEPDPPEELREDSPGDVTDLDDWEPMEPAIEDLPDYGGEDPDTGDPDTDMDQGRIGFHDLPEDSPFLRHVEAEGEGGEKEEY